MALLVSGKDLPSVETSWTVVLEYWFLFSFSLPETVWMVCDLQICQKKRETKQSTHRPLSPDGRRLPFLHVRRRGRPSSIVPGLALQRPACRLARPGQFHWKLGQQGSSLDLANEAFVVRRLTIIFIVR